MGKHSDAMEEAMALRGFAPKSQRVYLSWMRRLVKQSGKTADVLGESDVRAFLVGLTEQRRSVSTFNQAVSAFAFFYREVVPREWPLVTRRQRPPQRLPLTLSTDEVRRLLDAATTLRERAIMEIAYSGGLRLGEVLRLHRHRRPVIRVERGKVARMERDARRVGHRRRCVPLEAGEARRWLFPGGVAQPHHGAARIRGSEEQRRIDKPVASIRTGTASPRISWNPASTCASGLARPP